jgi:hypothetical protein
LTSAFSPHDHHGQPNDPEEDENWNQNLHDAERLS